MVGEIRRDTATPDPNLGYPRLSGRGYGDANTFVFESASPITLNAWHHVVYVIDRSGSPAKGFVYVDGVNQSGSGTNLPNLAGTLTMTAASGGANLIFGGNWADYIGEFDELVIYDRALSANQVLARYQVAPLFD